MLVNPQALIPLLLVAHLQRGDVHRLVDLADVPACQVRECLGLSIIEGAEGSSQTILLAR